MTKRNQSHSTIFTGFDRPESNWFRMPNSWTDITAEINNLAELKVVEYILRHTWGYQEYGLKKHITIDEFVNGRRRADGARMDKGTGLSERAVYDGLRKAVESGLIDEDVDASDRGRVKKFYSLHMRDEAPDEPTDDDLQTLQSGVQSLHPPLQSLQVRGARSNPRTEKDTLERINDSNIRMATPNVDNFLDEPRPNRQGTTEAIGETVARSPLRQAVATLQAHRVNVGIVEHGCDPEQTRHSGPVAIASRRGRLRRVPQSDETYQIIQAYIADFAREFNDQAPLRISTMRAYNLFQRAGVSREVFVEQLYAARTIVKERTASIRSQSGETQAGLPTKNKAAYYFAVLEDLLGLREARTKVSSPALHVSDRTPVRRRREATPQQSDGPVQRGWNKQQR